MLVGSIESDEKCIVLVELVVDPPSEDIALCAGNSSELVVRKNALSNV